MPTATSRPSSSTGTGTASAAGAEDRAHQRIAGLFDPGLVAGVEENAGDDVEGLLGTGNDHDLSGIAADGAGGAEIGADGFAKGLQAERMQIVGGVDVERAAVAGEEFRPEVEGELIEGGLMDAEGAPSMTPRIGFIGGKEERAARGATGGRVVGRGRAGLGGGMRERGGDEGAGADAAFEVALGEELCVGVEDGEAGDFELGSESAAGGDLLACGEVAAVDRVAKTSVDLAMEGHRGLAVDGDDGYDSCRDVEHLEGIVVVMPDWLQVVMVADHFWGESG